MMAEFENILIKSMNIRQGASLEKAMHYTRKKKNKRFTKKTKKNDFFFGLLVFFYSYPP